MSDMLATVLIIVALLLAGFAAVSALRRSGIGKVHLVATAIVEAVLLVQVVLAVVALAGGAQLDSPGTFIGYLIASLLVLPAGVVLGMSERGRWGAGVLAVAGCTLAVVVVRLQDLWSSTGG